MDSCDPTIQKYLVKLTGELEDDGEDFMADQKLSDDELFEDNLENLNSVGNNGDENEVSAEVDAGKTDDGVIIVDDEGNYYYQTTEGTVPVKPLNISKAYKRTPAHAPNLTKNARKSKRNTTKKQYNEEQLTPPEHLSESKAAEPTNVKTVKNSNANNRAGKRKTAKLTTKQKEETVVTESAMRRETRLMSAKRRMNSSEENKIVIEIDPVKCKKRNKNDNKRHKTEHDNDNYNGNDGDIYDAISAELDTEFNEVEEMAIETLEEPTDICDDDKPTRLKEFKCTNCDFVTNKSSLLTRHCKTHSDDRPFKCTVCERGFKTTAALINHMNTHLGKKPHACNDCEKRFTTSGELLRHVRYRHTGFKPHKCTECDYSSVEMSKLRRHMRCHTGERPYQCPHCTYASPDSFKLKRHLRTHTGEKPYECDICHGKFTQSNTLKYHRQIHSVNDKPVYQCNLCPTTCGRKTDLRTHMQKLHSTDKVWPCGRCGKELPDRYSFKVHIKTHEGEKCYRCVFCDYATTAQRYLESHLLIHSDEKPFTCQECNMKFRQKQLLTRHINLVHKVGYIPPVKREKKHQCPDCGRAFTFRGNLIRHMEVHDELQRSSSTLGNLVELSFKDELDMNGTSDITGIEESANNLDEDEEFIENLDQLIEKDEDIKLQSFEDNASVSSSRSDIVITYCPTENYEVDSTLLQLKGKQSTNNKRIAISDTEGKKTCLRNINSNNDINIALDLEDLEMNVMESIDIVEEKDDIPIVLNMEIENENNIELLENDVLNTIAINDNDKDPEIEYIYEELGADTEDIHGDAQNYDDTDPEKLNSICATDISIVNPSNIQEDNINLHMDNEIVILEVIQCGDGVEDN